MPGASLPNAKQMMDALGPFLPGIDRDDLAKRHGKEGKAQVPQSPLSAWPGGLTRSRKELRATVQGTCPSFCNSVGRQP